MNKRGLLALLLAAAVSAALAPPALAAGVKAQAPAVSRADPETNRSTVAYGKYLFSSAEGPIERVDLGTLERKTIVPQKDVYRLDHFVVQRDGVFWAGNNLIYRCALGGGGRASFKAGDQRVSNLRSDGEWLYYTAGGKLSRVKPDGKGKKSLGIGKVERFEVAGDWIFYRETGDTVLYRCPAAGGEPEECGETGEEWDPRVFGGKLYYTAWEAVGKQSVERWYCSMPNGQVKVTYASPFGTLLKGYELREASTRTMPGTGEEVTSRPSIRNLKTGKSFAIDPGPADCRLSSANYFYYLRSEQKDGKKVQGLYRVGWDGKNKEKLDEGGEPLLVSNGYLVYLHQGKLKFAKEA